MDSTLVHQLANVATQLGVQARTVLVWWFVARFAVHALWAGVVVFGLHRTTVLLGHVGQGMRLVKAVKAVAGTEFPSESAFFAAQQAIVDHVRRKS